MGVLRAAVERHTWDPQSPPSALLSSLSITRRNGPSCWWWRPRTRSLLLVEFICLASPPWLSRSESWMSMRVQSSAPTPSPSNWRRVYLQDLCSPPSLPRIQTALWAKASGKTLTRRFIFCLRMQMLESVFDMRRTFQCLGNISVISLLLTTSEKILLFLTDPEKLEWEELETLWGFHSNKRFIGSCLLSYICRHFLEMKEKLVLILTWTRLPHTPHLCSHTHTPGMKTVLMTSCCVSRKETQFSDWLFQGCCNQTLALLHLTAILMLFSLWGQAQPANVIRRVILRSSQLHFMMYCINVWWGSLICSAGSSRERCCSHEYVWNLRWFVCWIFLGFNDLLPPVPIL